MTKYILTALAAFDFVQVFDYFAWGIGTGADTVIYSIGFGICVYYIIKILNEEELENERN